MPLPSALERIVEDSWSAWLPVAGRSSPVDALLPRRNGELVSGGGKKGHCSSRSSNETPAKNPKNTHSRRLNNSEMIVFGHCPASEPLTLIPCSYCGHKYKCRFLPDHIRLRHFGAKKPVPKVLTPEKKKSPSHSKAKGKHSRLNRDRERLVDAQVTVENDDKAEDWPKSNANNVDGVRRNEREIPVTSVLPHCMMKLAAGEAVKEVTVTKPIKESVKVKLRKTKPQLAEPSPSVNLESHAPLEKSYTQKRESRVSTAEFSPGFEKSKAEVLSKKAKLDERIGEPVVEIKVEKGNSLDAAPDLSLSHEINIVEPKKKRGQKVNSSRGVRTYYPDSHCGVVSKDSARPCMRSLECKLHTISSRKAVKGRSKPFEVLLIAFQKGKELERNKVLEVDVIDSVPDGAITSNDDTKLKPSTVEVKANHSGEMCKLSLPVSILNPNLRSALISPELLTQSMSSHAQNNSTPPKPPVTNSVPFHKVLKDEKPVEFVKLSSVLTPPSTVNGFNKDVDLPYNGSIFPGYKKSAGLLTTSISVPRVQFKDKKRSRLNHSQVIQDKIAKKSSRYFLYLNGGLKEPSPAAHKTGTYLQCPSRNILATMPSIIDQMSPLKSLEGGKSKSSSIPKSLNLFGPINGTKILPLSLSTSSDQNSTEEAQPGFVKVNDKTVECKTVGLLSGDVVCLNSPRAHFFTPSGPLSVGADCAGAKKPDYLPVHSKRRYLPNSSLSAPTVVYLQRTLKTAH